MWGSQTDLQNMAQLGAVVSSGSSTVRASQGWGTSPGLSQGTWWGKVDHISYKAAQSIIQGAKLVMLKKVETLRDQAETAMLDMGE